MQNAQSGKGEPLIIRIIRVKSSNMHIGQRIKEVLKERGITVVAFARSIPCSRENVYRIFKNDNIDIHQLKRISKVLEHDFFKDISECDEWFHM